MFAFYKIKSLVGINMKLPLTLRWRMIGIIVYMMTRTATGAVTLSPINPEGLEHEPLTLTCGSNESTVTGFGWQHSVTEFITQTRICIVFNNITSSGCYVPSLEWEPDPVLYSYACLSRTRHTLTMKNVTSDAIGVKWRCMTYTPNEDSNIVTITLKVPVLSVVLKTPSTASVVVVEKSSPIDFWCEVPRSLPMSTIQWYHDNRTPDPPSTPVFHWQNETGAILPDNTAVVVKGDFFTIICDSDSKPGPPAYSWTNKQWTVTAITDAQKTCTVSNTLNPSGYKEESGSNTATVIIETLEPPGEPTFSYIDCQNKQVTFVEDIKIKLGIDVSVTCSSTGKPQPSFQWSSHQSNSPETFFLQGVTRQHNGSYTCTARNTMNTTFTDPPSVGLIERQILLEGGNLTVDCPVQPGNPVISTIKWTRREGTITTSTTNKVLKLVAVQRHQSDYYRCTATNHKASIESFRESSNPADVVTLNQGDPLNITCTVDSNPGAETEYVANIHAVNSIGSSGSISIFFTTLPKEDNGDNADNRPNSHMYTHLEASNSQLRVYYENVNK
ncbi:HMCN2-like protein, partial [Mya arenaria]